MLCRGVGHEIVTDETTGAVKVDGVVKTLEAGESGRLPDKSCSTFADKPSR